MVFRRIYPPAFQNSDYFNLIFPQVIEKKTSPKWPADCYIEGASDVPAAGDKSGQPKEQQTPGKSIRKQSGPEKGNDRQG
jgi:hypothetical protein